MMVCETRNALLALAIVALLPFAGCGGGGDYHPSSVGGAQPDEIAAPWLDDAAPYLFPVKMRPQEPLDVSEKAALAVSVQLLPEFPLLKTALQIEKDLGYTGDEYEVVQPQVQHTVPGLVLDGAEYDSSLPSERVMPAGKAAVFRSDADEPAYAVYRFTLTGYSGDSTMKFSWAEPPEDFSKLYAAFANFEKNTWEWYEGPDDFVLTIPDYDRYTHAETGACFCAVLLVGAEEATLARLSVGESEMRATGADYLISPEPMFGVELEVDEAVLPESVDLSSSCAPVNDQRYWPSCTAFAVGDGAYNYELNRIYSAYGWNLHNPQNRVSPKHLYIVSGELQGWPPEPSYCRFTGDVVKDLKDHGVATEFNVPYNLHYSNNWSKDALADAELLTIEDWDYISCLTEEGLQPLKFILARQRRPVVMQVKMDENFFYYMASEVWNYTGPGKGRHAMCVVGYDDALQAFKVRNSWGRSWGDSGHVWIGYETFLNPYAHVACWTLEDEYSPEVALRFLGPHILLPSPSNVEASDGEDEYRVRVTWTHSSGATSYLIFRDELDNKVGATGRVDEWFDTTLHDFYTHTYWVRAADSSRTSLLSNSDTGYAGRGG